MISFLKRFKTEATYLAIAAGLQLFGLLPKVQQFLNTGADELAVFVGSLIAVLGLFGINTVTRKLDYYRQCIGPKTSQEIEAEYTSR